MSEPGQTAYGETPPAEDLISVGTLFRVFWKWLWVVVLVAIILAGVAVGLSLQQPPQYQASIKVLVGQDRGIVESPEDAFALQNLTQTMVEAVNSRPIGETVIEELNLQSTPEELLAGMSAEEVPDTQFIQVSYTDTDPERAKLVANTIGNVFSERISEVSPNANLVTITVWERAQIPEAPVSPNPVRTGFLALVLGCMLGLGLAFLLEYLDDRWRSPDEAEQVSGVPTLGIIPAFEPPKKRGREKKKKEKDGS